MFRRRLRIPRAGLARPIQRRSMHHVPSLPHDFRNGVPGLLSAQGFDIAWTQYMTVMLDKLNALVAGTELEAQDTKTILISTARSPAQAPIFNHASMAHNNHFFFKNLSPTPTPMPAALQAEVEKSFSSVETLRREFVATAAAMFGPGFVWLVKAGSSDYRVLTTYLAGSPYSDAHWRRQSTDLNTTGQAGTAAEFMRRQTMGLRGGFSGRKNLPPGGVDLIPLLCLNTWEHVWLADYGLGVGGLGGKRAFAEAWWNAVDWEAVASAATITRPQLKLTGGILGTTASPPNVLPGRHSVA